MHTETQTFYTHTEGVPGPQMVGPGTPSGGAPWGPLGEALARLAGGARRGAPRGDILPLVLDSRGSLPEGSLEAPWSWILPAVFCFFQFLLRRFLSVSERFLSFFGFIPGSSGLLFGASCIILGSSWACPGLFRTFPGRFLCSSKHFLGSFVIFRPLFGRFLYFCGRFMLSQLLPVLPACFSGVVWFLSGRFLGLYGLFRFFSGISKLFLGVSLALLSFLWAPCV